MGERTIPRWPSAEAAADARRTPRRLYGELFEQVQMQRICGDGKTFVDAVPRLLEPAAVVALFEHERGTPGFDLAHFVRQHFLLPRHEVPVGPRLGVREHIASLWPQLARPAHDPAAHSPHDTRLPLPQPYVVPGGRFRELYYWDSYFTILGLLDDGEHALARDLLGNFESLIERYGFVPNSSRSYMLGRSQPPLLFKIVQAVEGGGAAGAAAAFAHHLPALQAEHRWWMSGEDTVAPGQAHRRVVRLADGTLLNRYFDDGHGPREESWREDVLTADAAPGRDREAVWLNLRAAAESGWDFSSRWCADPDRIETIETTAILPVDLNALLCGLELALAEGSAHLGQHRQAEAWRARAAVRRAAIDRLMWCAARGHYVDHHWLEQRPCHALTAAALMPLYVGIASPAQADAMARVVSGGLLAKNGLLATLRRTGQQWDAPNGWAPLQWIAAVGLARCGRAALAREIAQRWTAAVHRVYLESGRLLEKYDVIEDRPGGGGEYETQDGFGWTNGVYVAFARDLLRD